MAKWSPWVQPQHLAPDAVTAAAASVVLVDMESQLLPEEQLPGQVSGLSLQLMACLIWPPCRRRLIATAVTMPCLSILSISVAAILPTLQVSL